MCLLNLRKEWQSLNFSNSNPASEALTSYRSGEFQDHFETLVIPEETSRFLI